MVDDKKNDIENNQNSTVLNDLKSDLANQVGDEVRKASKKLSLKSKLLIAFIALGLIATIGYFTYDRLFVNKGHQLYTISESTLTDVIEISNLSTLEFTYNAIVTVSTDGEKPTVKYYVAYEGIVTAGIDLKNVDVSIDENIITITIPDATIQSVNVNPGTLEYIFEKNRYDTQDVPSEAYKICKDDLERRAKEETDLLMIAKENAISAINALIEPWVSEVSKDYVVEVK